VVEVPWLEKAGSKGLHAMFVQKRESARIEVANAEL
jgi:hypothetical protein